MLMLISGGLTMLIFCTNWFSVLSGIFLMGFLFMLVSMSVGEMFLMSDWLFSFNFSSSLILLSIWIVGLMVLASASVYKTNMFADFFLKVSLVLLISLILSFSFQDLMGFYFSFEISLLPTLLLVLGWGYQPERIQAGIYMLFYTLFGSMPLLVFMLMEFKTSGSSYILNQLHLNMVDVNMWVVAGVLAFFMKLPVYFLHLWLPKAHVEAPIAGSMILAGVLLKLGGYGIVVLSSWFIYSVSTFLPIFMTIGLLGGAWVGVMCLRQTDMKSLVAYSSVAHMGLVLGGILAFNFWGLNGGLEVMLGHGLCSSGLFFLVNTAYERSNSRSMFISKGMLNSMPSMSFWWFLLCVSNMAAPPSLNLLGEVSLFISVMGWSYKVWVSLFMLSFFSGAYSLYLFSLTQHGKGVGASYTYNSGLVSEYFVLVLHWFPLNLIILKSSFIMFSSS